MHDVIIVGAGAAGLTAAIYAVRYKLNALVLTKTIGGMALNASFVENFPGFKGTGIELMKKFREHAESLGVKIKTETVKEIKKDKDQFTVVTDSDKYHSRTIMLAFGTELRKLNIPGEKEFLNKGISYCAVCDGPFYKNKIVGVAGGSNAAAQTALLLTQYAKTVYMIYRKEELRADPILIEKLKNNKKIKIIYNANIVEITGKEFVEKVKLSTGEYLNLEGLFIEIGSEPSINLAKKMNLKLDNQNYIIVDNAQKTSQGGVYAAGDITTASNNFRQIITACAEGAIAARSVYNFVRELK